MKLEITRELLLQWAATPSETNLINTNRGVICSPLSLARSCLTSYGSMFFWKFPGRSHTFTRFNQELKELNAVDNNTVSYLDSPQDAVPELAQKLRSDFCNFQKGFTGYNGDYSREDRRLFLEILDELIAKEANIRENRHPLAEAIQEHFYFAVAVPWQSKWSFLHGEEHYRESQAFPAIFKAASEARDALYLKREGAEGAYFRAVEAVTEDPSYRHWLSLGDGKSRFTEVKSFEEITKLQSDLETDLLWLKNTAA